jgi:hypothetical protein
MTRSKTKVPCQHSALRVEKASIALFFSSRCAITENISVKIMLSQLSPV